MDIEDTDMADMEDTDTTERKRGPPMLNQQLQLLLLLMLLLMLMLQLMLMLGTPPMVMVLDTVHMDMVDMV